MRRHDGAVVMEIFDIFLKEKIHLDRSVSKWIYYTIENSTMCFEPAKRNSQPREARFFMS